MSEKVLRVFTDGASKGNPGPSGIGVVLVDGKREIEISKSIGTATNNIAEYKAVIAGLEKALELKAEAVELYSDSELLVRQLKGIYKVRDKKLLKLWEQTNNLLARFKTYKLNHIPRERNVRADSLARQAIKKCGSCYKDNYKL
jgi:ribonuclease HI